MILFINLKPNILCVDFKNIFKLDEIQNHFFPNAFKKN